MRTGIMRFLWVSFFFILKIISIYGHRLIEEECSALSALKQSLKFDVEYSLKLASWNLSTECCSWSGVTCENNRVIALDLSLEDINGGLDNSSNLFDLQHLKTLNFAGNNFSTPIPSAIGRLVNLRSLDLSANMFSGPLPDFSRLRKLTYLSLYGNSLTGALPSLLFALPSFRGDSPHSIQNFSQIEVLDLSYNMFSGPIPELNRLRKLTHLNLGSNLLTGALPSSLFELPFLEVMELSFNYISGMLPEFSHALSSPISVMHLGNNKLQGPLPLSLFNFHNISELDLSFNNFSGSIDLSELQKLENLEIFDLSYNSLSITTGSSNLPWFANRIGWLSLASCNLTAFPNLVNCSGLNHLDLSNNLIQGEIPKWIWNVVEVNLSSNLLEGFERPFTGNHSASPLMIIDLHNNMVRGPLLSFLPKHAFYVDYSDNRLTSTIPIGIGDYLTYASSLSLSNNQIVGTLPVSMCNATVLQVLDLSHNHLGGTIPHCLFNMSRELGVVDLSGNKLKGAVPGTFSQGCALSTLDLNHNMIEGEIPITLASCTGLEVLNLAHNTIHDKFPCWLKDLPNLRVIVLRSNELTGQVRCSNTINPNMWRRLQIIDLASNKLFGALPSEFFTGQNAMTEISTEGNSTPKQLGFKVFKSTNGYYLDKVTIASKGQQLELVRILTVYTSVDFSSNMFDNEIPHEIGCLTAVHVLNLSHNALVGQIPSTLGNMRALESLDLSHNFLSGSIPEQLQEVTFLSYLDLSFNQLEGKIPSGGQFQTFQESAFLGNKGLCGSPLSVKCKDDRGSSSIPLSPKVAGRSSQAGFLIKWDFMIGSEVGFIFGLLIAIGPLVFYPRWSRFYCKHLDNVLLTASGIRPNPRQKRYASIIR